MAGLGTGVVRQALADSLTPPLTQGPFWVDERLLRSDIRSDPSTGVVQQGYPMYFGITVSQLVGMTSVPFPNAYVDLWQTNALGLYSDVAQNGTVGQRWLRGYQISDNHGAVRFITLYPGWYSGRTIHIHCRIRTFNGMTVTSNFTTQFFFDDTVSTNVFDNWAPYNTRGPRNTFNSNDGIYNSQFNGASAGSQLMLRLSPNATSAVASFNLVLAFASGARAGTPTLPLSEEAAAIVKRELPANPKQRCRLIAAIPETAIIRDRGPGYMVVTPDAW
jgi:protocatechuate 3,4-dioxygenase beta subunit